LETSKKIIQHRICKQQSSVAVVKLLNSITSPVASCALPRRRSCLFDPADMRACASVLYHNENQRKYWA